MDAFHVVVGLCFCWLGLPHPFGGKSFVFETC